MSNRQETPPKGAVKVTAVNGEQRATIPLNGINFEISYTPTGADARFALQDEGVRNRVSMNAYHTPSKTPDSLFVSVNASDPAIPTDITAILGKDKKPINVIDAMHDYISKIMADGWVTKEEAQTLKKARDAIIGFSSEGISASETKEILAITTATPPSAIKSRSK